jgi:CheY-specific phosphatase CheX
MQVRVTAENIEKANAQFWEQMLAMRLEPISLGEGSLAEPVLARCIGPEHVVGSCDLAGVWVGRIEVRLSSGLARQATAAMLMQPVEAVEAADTLDATKEIANMIAGTIKSVLPRPCTMTVPTAEVESGDFCIVPRTPDSVTVFFHHEAGELMVRVRQQMSDTDDEVPDSKDTALNAESKNGAVAEMCS